MNKTQLRLAVSGTGSHFFDADAMRFFNSRLETGGFEVNAGTVFITSEQFDDETPRLFTVRLFHNGSVTDIGGFQRHKTLDSAKKMVKSIIAHPCFSPKD